LVGRHKRYRLAPLDELRAVEHGCQCCGVLPTGFDRHDTERVTAQPLGAEEVLVHDDNLEPKLPCRGKVTLRQIDSHLDAAGGKSSTVRTVVVDPPLTASTRSTASVSENTSALSEYDSETSSVKELSPSQSRSTRSPMAADPPVQPAIRMSVPPRGS